MTKGNSDIVVVTGASGFIGRFLCGCLEQNGFSVIRAGRSSSDDFYCDLRLPESVLSLGSLPKYKAFVHLGAQVGLNGSSLEDMYMPNVASTALIADLTRKNDAHLVFASTAIIAGLNSEKISPTSKKSPDTPYAQSKELAEQCIAASSVSSAVLRIGGVYGFNGPTHLGLNRTIQRALNGELPVVFGAGTGKRNYIYVQDLALIIVHTILARVAGTHLVSGHDVLSIAEMYQLVSEVFKLSSLPLFRPGSSSRSQLILSSPNFTGKSSFADSLISIKHMATQSS